MLVKGELRDAIPLAFANKQDLPNTVKVAEITEKLGVHHRNCYVRATCATSAHGLYERPDWLSNWLRNRK
uniref:Uncharacterized protein n=1 Tax=Lynx canadensis TaxID=61383 RepID=A0A667H9F2_LYNCA